ncbi:DUF4153 domain-containing protein [Oceanibium sediminis]|uniref:DUF4153 domain-containing protein n=1 Tax=Oceanibium sediminis TaxID=2026339 RepID=UPI000DD40831|nr:DUF4153 domain-containing protein [Oceanibium sediminis]
MTGVPAMRAALAITGVIAGAAYYLLIEEEVLRSAPVEVQRAVVYFAIALFPAFGLMAGPLPPRRAGAAALALATLCVGLVTWTGLRFPAAAGAADGLLDPTGEGLIIAPFIGFVAVLIPVVTAALQARGGWRDYGRLIPLIWIAATKSLISLLFLILFWSIYFLSDALLQLAGVEVLDDLFDVDPSVFVISGGVIGLSLAVTCELEEVITTLLKLVLRLLRLLLVPVAVVLSVFVGAVILQGLDEVFSSRSAAATMMSMAAGTLVLIAAALNFHDREAATHPAIRWTIRILGLVLPVVAGIALYALWIRVAQYGWTPQRLLGVLCGLVILGFVLPVTLFALRAAPGWQARTLSGFVAALIGTLALTGLWFTPLLNAQAIAAASQLARFQDKLPDADYDLWPLARQWGAPGRAALEELKAMDLSPALRTRIATIEGAETRYSASREIGDTRREDAWATLQESLPVRPAGARLPDFAAIEAIQTYRFNLEHYVRSCDEAPRPPACAAVQGDFLPATPGLEWMLISQSAGRSWMSATLLYRDQDGAWQASGIATDHVEAQSQSLIPQILSGAYEIAPPRMQSLQIGPVRLSPKSERGE